METVSTLSARLSSLPDPVPDDEADALADLLANAGCAWASVAVLAGQRSRGVIIDRAAEDLLVRQGGRR